MRTTVARALTVIGTSLTVIGCGLPEPLNDETDPPAGADRAEAYLVETLRRELDAPDEAPPTVRWFAGKCLRYDDHRLEDFECLGGIRFYGDLGTEIHLAWRESPSDSSLVHEMVHWAVGGDPSHKRPVWSREGEFVAGLRERGL